MDSILNEIKRIRRESELSLDLNNSNRYRIVACNDDGTKTAYCFSAPLYNVNTLKTVDLKFHRIGSKITATGSNTLLDFVDKIQMKNHDGMCSIVFDSSFTYKDDKTILCGEKDTIHLTSNGIVYNSDMSNKSEVSFEIETSKKYDYILKNNGYYSFMREKFRPFLIISCIGCLDKNENMLAPAEITCEQISEYKSQFTVTPCISGCNYMKFEINLYEQKNFQDTTVESLHPSKRNAFGSIAFVGNTEWFGKQWLYIRPEILPNIDLINKETNYIIMRLPKLSNDNIPIIAFETVRKFCSFGSRWEKRVPSSKFIGNLSYDEYYAKLDITNLVMSEEKNKVSIIDGIIIKPDTNDMGFIALATGDNYNTPPILEINYNI